MPDVASGTLSGGSASRTVTGAAGWRICEDGRAEFDSAAIRGGLTASFAQITGSLTAAQVSAIRIDASQITTGILSADHVDADVRNWQRLYSRTSGSSHENYSTVDSTGDIDDYDTLVFFASAQGSVTRQYAVNGIKVSRIPSTGTTTELQFWTGFGARLRRTSTQVQIDFNYNTGWSAGRLYELWGVNA